MITLEKMNVVVTVDESRAKELKLMGYKEVKETPQKQQAKKHEGKKEGK